MISFPLPIWLSCMPDGTKKDIAIKRFFMRLAAVYATPSGQVILLADLIDIHPKTLISQMTSKVRTCEHTIDGIARILRPAEIRELRDIHRRYE